MTAKMVVHHPTQFSGENLMSAPSRRPEIRRRRTRHEKILKLRKRHAAAPTEAEKKQIAAKLHRLSLRSPGSSLIKAE
jgi:Family of unknown function (DUF6800)